MEGVKKGGNPYKQAQDVRKDRRSATGMSGEPKKGGRGGKFTWAGTGGYTEEEYNLITGKDAVVGTKGSGYEEGSSDDGGSGGKH